MHTIPHNVYEELTDRLIESIGSSDYFSGNVTAIDANNSYKLIASIIIYRHKSHLHRDANRPIRKIVPVWWELQSYIENEEVENDFDFNIFKNLFYKCVN
ncbi:MAG: hypothetical protein SNG14_03350 [Rikenellaceae bacterium]